MKPIHLLAVALLINGRLAAQTPGYDSLQKATIALINLSHHYSDSIINYPKTLDHILGKKFSMFRQDYSGRWVYYSEKANIQKVDKPKVNQLIPQYRFYEVRLTNHLDFHVIEAPCLILFDSLKSDVLLIEPLWYGDISKCLVKLFIGKKFESKEALQAFLKALHELLEIGSIYKFVNTVYTDSVTTCDLVATAGSSYTTGNNGTSSIIQYNQDQVWRKISIDLKDLTIIRYTSTNPATNEKKVVE